MGQRWVVEQTSWRVLESKQPTREGVCLSPEEGVASTWPEPEESGRAYIRKAAPMHMGRVLSRRFGCLHPACCMTPLERPYATPLPPLVVVRGPEVARYGIP